MKQDNKIVLGIAYLYSVINAVFFLISMLQIDFSEIPIGEFLLREALWIVIAFASILVLYKLNKKQNQGFCAAYHDNTIRKTAGALITINALMSFSTYIPSVIFIVTQICKNNYELDVVPNVVCTAIIALQIVFGIYLMKCKGKNAKDFKAQIAIGVAFLYTIITAAFYLVRNLAHIIISRYSFGYFYLWIIFTAAILLVLFILNKKQNQSFVSIFQNNTIRKSAGVLVIVGGLLSIGNLSNTVINYIMLSRGVYGDQISMSITTTLINFIVFACKVLFGIYLINYKSKSAEKDITE